MLHVVITVDFGMTGSAAEWWTSFKNPGGVNGPPHLIGKLPTKLIYGNDGRVIAWGSSCTSAEGTTKNFKEQFAKENSPEGLRELKRWTSDFLRHFCTSVIDEIAKVKNVNRSDLELEWHLTSPGPWAPSIRRDFGELASRVLKDISPNSQVFSSLTEAEASCAYLVERLEFAPGTCAITCDIGGATTDIAAAILHDINGVLVPTNVFPTIYGSGVKINVSQIDHEFERYVGETYQEEAVDDSWWSEQRHGFDGSNDVPLWPRNNLSVNRNLEKLQLSARVISSAKMRGFFEEFLSDICGAIEAALQALNKNDMQNFPTAIALCGGGGTMKMLVQRLRERFSEFTIRVLPSTNESCLATIIGHRYHLMKLELSSYLDETSIGLSTGFSRVPITWRTASRLTCFNDSARGRKAKHLFISQPASAKGPISGSDVNDNTDFSAWPDTIIWELEVRLGKRWAETRYCIEVACTGRKTFSFRAFDAERPEKTYEIADVLRS